MAMSTTRQRGFVQVGRIRLSHSGKTILVELKGASGVAWTRDLQALLMRNLDQIPIKQVADNDEKHRTHGFGGAVTIEAA